MEYRKLSKGGEMISTLGLSMGGIHKTTPDEIEAVIRSHCTARCPFRVDRQTRIHTIAEYFK